MWQFPWRTVASSTAWCHPIIRFVGGVSSPRAGTFWIKVKGGKNPIQMQKSELENVFSLLKRVKAEVAPKLAGVALDDLQLFPSEAMKEPIAANVEVAEILGGSFEEPLYLNFDELSKQLAAAAKVQAGRQLRDVTSMRGRPNPGDWIQAEPMLCETANFEALQVVAKRLDADIIAAVKDPAGTNRRGSLLLAAQNGMGTGKSHLVDSLSDILPLLRGGITLKVTYNFDQDLHNDVSNYHERSHIQCLLTRIALATRMERCQGVELDITMNGWVQDHENSLAAFLHEEYHDRPILIAVDELASLFDAAKAQFGESAYAAMREVLSVLRRLCERVNDLREWDTSRLCLAFVTALPSLEITTLSRYPPLWLDPISFTVDEATNLLVSLMERQGVQLDEQSQETVVALSGRHPRSLVVMFQLMARGLKLDLAGVAPKLKWSKLHTQSWLRDDVHDIVKATYMREAGWEGVVQNSMMFKQALLFEVEDEGPEESSTHARTFAIPPLLTRVKGSVATQDWMGLIYGIDSDDPTKDFEHVNVVWDRTRAALRLPLVPPGYDAFFDPSQQKMVPAPFLRFLFDTERAFLTKPVLNQGFGIEISDLDKSEYIVPGASNHPAFEALFQVADAEGRQYVCLHQQKVNNKLKMAIEKLNKAADALQAQWNNLHFIYLCVLLEGSGDPVQALKNAKPKHPVVYVNHEKLTRYYTATFAPAARLCSIRHTQKINQDINEKLKSIESCANSMNN